MDPVACLARAWGAFYEGEHAEAREALNDYRTWRAAGGFEPGPDGDGTACGDERADALARSLDALPPEGLFADRSRNDEDGGSTRRIWAFERVAVEAWLAREGETIESAMRKLATWLTGAGEVRGRPGGWFWREPSVEVTCGRVFVRQTGAFDV